MPNITFTRLEEQVPTYTIQGQQFLMVGGGFQCLKCLRSCDIQREDTPDGGKQFRYSIKHASYCPYMEGESGNLDPVL